MSRDDATAVEAANTSLYTAVESADLDLMGALWMDGPEAESVVCVHPGWPPLHGRSEVLRSWAAIMAGTPYVQFFLTDVQVSVQGDAAVVTCTENVLTGGDGGASFGFPGGRVAATNVFRRSDGGWRLWVHHASPVLSALDDEDPAEPGRTDEDSGGTPGGEPGGGGAP